MKLFLTGDDEVAAALGFEKLEREREVERSKNEVRKGRGIYRRGEKTVRPKKLDERAPDPSHSLDMCHPRTERWQSREIVGE